MYKCKYFGIKELVSKIVYDYFTPRYGEAFIWAFFDDDDKKDLDTIRETWGKPIIINNWAVGGSLSQCGLRCNLDPLVKTKNTPYCGGHNLAKGFDLHDKGGDNAGLWKHIRNLIVNKKLRKIRRLENIKSTPTWVHGDSIGSPADGLCIFNA